MATFTGSFVDAPAVAFSLDCSNLGMDGLSATGNTCRVVTDPLAPRTVQGAPAQVQYTLRRVVGMQARRIHVAAQLKTESGVETSANEFLNEIESTIDRLIIEATQGTLDDGRGNTYPNTVLVAARKIGPRTSIGTTALQRYDLEFQVLRVSKPHA